MGKKFDLVIFGASGFTGQYVVEEVARLARDKDVEPFTWAVAGRSKAKLSEVLDQASKFIGFDVRDTEIIAADVDSPETIHKMARQAVVVLNCVGPYRFWGEMVVEACIEEGAHHLDISGEAQFLEKVQLLHHKKAEEKGVYVVGACGWDSIPTDLGVAFLKEKFKGDLNSVEMVMELGHGSTKSSINTGTWVSAINIIAHIRELKPIREKLFKNKLPEPKYPMAQRSVVHYNENVNGWCLPFLGSDKSVVERSERFFYENEQQTPVQINTYSKQPNLIQTIFMIFAFMFVGVMSQFRFTRNLLINYPRLLTLGFVQPPTRESADFPFTCTLSGEGWKDKVTGRDQHQEPPNQKTTVKVKGRNPGYGATVICFVQSALTVLRESSKMPSTGGVYTTSAAFSKTSIIPRLHKSGLTFEVVGQE